MDPSPRKIENVGFLPKGSWVHFVAGGFGGMCGAMVTAPFDLVKTRLQSDLYNHSSTSSLTSLKSKGKATTQLPLKSTAKLGFVRNSVNHFIDTGRILREIYRYEGPRALFKGLGPTLIGVAPARMISKSSINFFSYGNGKQIYAKYLNDGKENAAIHLISAFTAGVMTSTATNPIWVVKTHLQLENSRLRNLMPNTLLSPTSISSSTLHAPILPPSTSPTTPSSSSLTKPFSPNIPPKPQTSGHFAPPGFTRGPSAAFGFSSSSKAAGTMFVGGSSMGFQFEKVRPLNSWQVIVKIFRNDGIPGFYKGLSASYLGCAETTIQWTLYEQFKRLSRPSYSSSSPSTSAPSTPILQILSSGLAKLIATSITYPHEVVRTRLRQPVLPGEEKKYRGLFQTFQVVIREEGWRALYGGLSPHLMRVVPNAVVMFGIYEGVLAWSGVGTAVGGGEKRERN